VKDIRPEAGRGRFPVIKLTAEDRAAVRRLERAGGHYRMLWVRIRALLLLDEEVSVVDVAKALGTYPRSIRRVGWRYVDGGLEHALAEEVRAKPKRLLDKRQETAIVAMTCSSPPEGRSRWTVALIAQEASLRGIVEKVGRETIRVLLQDHDLKPWREKNVVRPKAGRRIPRANGRPSRSLREAARSD
jgi:putative transposase